MVTRGQKREYQLTCSKIMFMSVAVVLFYVTNVESNLSKRCFYCEKQFYNSTQRKERPTSKITFLLHHYAWTKKNKHPHYTEIEAAIMSNLINPALDEVFVIYQSAGLDNCTALRNRLKIGLAKSLRRMIVPFTCVNKWRQFLYRELFYYASHQIDVKFKGDVVVLANADCVTDLSIAKVKAIKPNYAVALSVTGGPLIKKPDTSYYVMPYIKGNRPLRKAQTCIYEEATGYGACDEKSRCFLRSEKHKYGMTTYSWDAWVFRPPLPDLDRTLMNDEVKMQSCGGENRAGAALFKAGVSGNQECEKQPNEKEPNACNVCPDVNLWTYHCQRDFKHERCSDPKNRIKRGNLSKYENGVQAVVCTIPPPHENVTTVGLMTS